MTVLIINNCRNKTPSLLRPGSAFSPPAPPALSSASPKQSISTSGISKTPPLQNKAHSGLRPTEMLQACGQQNARQ